MLGYHIFSDHRYSTHCEQEGRGECTREQGYGITYLDAEVASIDVISQEEVPRIGGAPADFEQLHQVILLHSQGAQSARW